ncbi:type III secretory pathway component EscR [Bradyrhizobium diazoefficiens]
MDVKRVAFSGRLSFDPVISNILLAMGMMMVSPMTISLPFKLFLLVAVNGWQRLIHGLVLSYAGPAS